MGLGRVAPALQSTGGPVAILVGFALQWSTAPAFVALEGFMGYVVHMVLPTLMVLVGLGEARVLSFLVQCTTLRDLQDHRDPMATDRSTTALHLSGQISDPLRNTLLCPWHLSTEDQAPKNLAGKLLRPSQPRKSLMCPTTYSTI